MHRKSLALFSLQILFAGSLQAAVIITGSDSGNGDQQQYAGTVLNNDLIENGSASLDSVVVTGYTAFTFPPTPAEEPGAPDYVLNDGSHGPDTDANTNGGSAFEVKLREVCLLLITF